MILKTVKAKLHFAAWLLFVGELYYQVQQFDSIIHRRQNKVPPFKGGTFDKLILY